MEGLRLFLVLVLASGCHAGPVIEDYFYWSQLYELKRNFVEMSSNEYHPGGSGFCWDQGGFLGPLRAPRFLFRPN